MGILFAAMSADDDEPTFESADAGASDTFPQQAGEIKKGSYLMIKGNPCKCVEASTSKTGKHGHAKAHIVAIDIFTGKKLEELCPSSHNVSVPFIKRTEMQVLTADMDSGDVSLLKEDGDTKDDLKLPKDFKEACADTTKTDDEKLSKEIVDAAEKGDKDVMVVVLEACSMEKII